MSGSIYGKMFTISTFGESHGAAVGVVVDGVTPGLELTVADIQRELDRRRPGQSSVTTPRREPDAVSILSGVFKNKTTGAPIMLLVNNSDVRSKDYSALQRLFRPGHADFTYVKKYGIRDYRGGGRSSGRETVARVAAGAIAKKLLAARQIQIRAYTTRIGNIACQKYLPDAIEKNAVRACDPDCAADMEKLVLEMAAAGNSVGGIVECRINGVPPGIGEPVFDKLDAELAKAMMSLGGIKGIEFGAGFKAATMTGKEHNDEITCQGFVTNNAGGILGGISNGAEIVFRVAVKPTSSIALSQHTIDVDGNPVVCETRGRHDPCLCPRVVPVVEAMSAIVLIDLIKQQAALSA